MPQVGIIPQGSEIGFYFDTEVFHSTTNAVLTTALDLPGRGRASIILPQNPANEPHFLKVTVDGIVVINDRELGWDAKVSNFIGVFDFYSSILVEHRNAGGVNAVRVLICYVIL